MFTPLEDAAKVFCTPSGFILKRLTTAKRLTKRRGEEILVDLHDVADTLGCPREVIDLVAQGKEWLLREDEVEDIYGCKPSHIRNIAGGPAFIPRPYPAVYRASPFIAWLRENDAVARERVKEGKNGITGAKVSGQRVRRKVRGPR